MDYENHKPIVYLVYNYLKDNCIGYENRQESWQIMDNFGITDNKEFRYIIKEIRQSERLQKFVCSKSGRNGGYWIPVNNKEIDKTLEDLRLRAMEMLKTYSNLKRKARLNKQGRLRFNKYEKEVYKSLMEE